MYKEKITTFSSIELEIMKNLNSLIKNDHSIKSGNIEIVFRKIKERLIQEIDKSNLVFGAVAWLVDKDVLKALSFKQCQIVLQKEDFLRPDLAEFLSDKDKKCLQDLYQDLSCNLNTTQFQGKIVDLVRYGIFDLQPVTCFGYYNQRLRHCTPKMHNKFFIFATLDKYTNKVEPQKVWTGSANITQMSMHSLENGVIIDDKDIANSYMKEYEQIYFISDKLNWNSNWYLNK